jgi:hypothetical protein
MDRLYPRLNALHKALRGSPLDKEAFRFYQDALQSREWPEVDRAIRKHAETSRFFPSPYEILEKIPKAPGYDGPAYDPADYLHQREWRERLASEYRKLPPAQKETLRKAFMRTANGFTKRRIRDATPEKLADNMCFRIFLESRLGDADRDEEADRDGRRNTGS